jgi:hypothetical protein
VSQRQLAALMHVSVETIRTWRHLGMPYKERDNGGSGYSFDLEACQQWRDASRPSLREELAEARATLAHEQARAATLEADLASGALVSKSELAEAKAQLAVDFNPEALTGYLAWRACQSWAPWGDNRVDPVAVEAEVREFVTEEIEKLVQALNRPLLLSNVTIDPRSR